jgi:hypothetical protein
MTNNRLKIIISFLSVPLFAALLGPAVHGQGNYIGPGSTPQGDYLRGAGIAAWGMGQYNLNTAQAEAINLDTTIRFNEYVAAVANEANREYHARIYAESTKVKEFYKQNRARLLESPEAHDVLDAAALNRLLESIQNSKVGESELRASQFRVPLSVDLIRKIPFKVGDAGERFSMDRLCLKDKGTWTPALQDDRFLPYKKAYAQALDTALEQAIDGKMQETAIKALETASEELLTRLDQVIGQRDDWYYTEAKRRLTELRGTARLLTKEKVERAIAEIDKYSGTTVGDLIGFMQTHNLHFAKAETPEDRKLLPELYALLKEQRDKLPNPAK